MGAPQIVTLSQRIAERRGTASNLRHLHPSEPVPMGPFMRRLIQKRLDAKVLYNGSWTAPDDGGAA